MLDIVKNFKTKIKNENLPLSIKYEYLNSLNNILKTYEYSFFAFKENIDNLVNSFNREVYMFNEHIEITFSYLRENGNFLGLDKNSFIYGFLLNNLGVLMFMEEDYRAYDIVSELRLEKKFDAFKITDDYVLKLKEIFLHLKKYGDLPVQTDRVFKLDNGTYMGSFLAHNKKRIYRLKEGNEYAYAISDYFEKKYLSYDDRLKEVYEYLLINNSLPYIGDIKVKFSNGEVMSYFISHNRNKISLMDNDMAKAITNHLNSRKLKFKDKLEEFYDYIVSNNEVNRGIFSDGSYMKSFIYDNKEKIILESKDNDKARYILDYFNRSKVSFNDRLEEVILFFNENGYLPNKSDKNICFLDDVYMGRYIYNHLDLFKNCGISYIEDYLIKKEESKLNFDDKVNEIYEYVLKYKCLPDKYERFSNNEIMSYFIAHNKIKLSTMDDDRAVLILKYIEDRKSLGFEEKILELYELCINGLTITKGSKFSDGVNIKGWLSDNKNKLKKLKDNENVLFIWKKCYKLTYEEKLLEAYEYISLNGYIPFQSDRDATFSDGTFIGMWLSNNKRKIYDNEIMRNKLLEIKKNYFSRLNLNEKKLIKR